MTDNTFLYPACLGAVGALLFFWKSATPAPKSPAPEILKASLRLSARFSLSTVLPWGLLWLSERYAWFADRPGIDLLFMGLVFTLMGAILWVYLRALYPLAAELRRLKPEAAHGAPPLSKMKVALLTGGVYAFASLCLSLAYPHMQDRDPKALASHSLLYPPATFIVGFAAGWLLPRATSPSTFRSRMWGWYVFGLVIGLARVRLDHLAFDLVGTAVSSFVPALLFAWIFGFAERGLAAPSPREKP